KVNEKELHAPRSPQQVDNLTSSDGQAQNPMEQQLINIWQEVLGIANISRTANFFEIGGDSILSIQIVAKARTAGLQMRPNQLFEQQTIEELAKVVEWTAAVTEEQSLADLPEIPQDEFPLSFMQEAFLLHHLQTDNDQGFLQLEFWLEGEIEHDFWETAWQKTAALHPVLLTYIDQEKTLQRVATASKLAWQYHDWQALNATEFTTKLAAFRAADRAQQIDLFAPPVGRFSLIKTTEQRYLLFWTCHHILIDGWSGGIILKDALTFYQKIKNKQPLQVPSLPSYASFLHWQNNQQNDAASQFWSNYLQGIEQPPLFQNTQISATAKQFVNQHFTIDTELTQRLHQFAKAQRVTTNTLLKGVWTCLLSAYFQQELVTFGTTVTGRFGDFPKINEIAGLFMNVLPARVQVAKGQPLSTFLQQLQLEQTALSTYEHNTLEEINNWTAIQQTTPIFDNLFVFGNFIKDGLNIGDLKVVDFQGGFTSTYPLTIRVNPTTAFEFDLRYNAKHLSAKTIDWLATQLKATLKFIIQNNEISVEQLFAKIALPPMVAAVTTSLQQAITEKPDVANFIAARNPTELTLTKIWEELLGINPIGIRDNFFELGGKSLTAMRLFARIETDLAQKISPVTLFKNPTIEALAKLVSGESGAESLQTIVPMRASGSKAPLFCIHAGGAHIFFYEGLTRYLDDAQPVYAIQPSGLDGTTNFHTSIEEMASSYLAEVRKVQPHGPYHLLGHCFSNAVCLEMANQLEALGEEVFMYIIDSAPAHLIPLEKSKPVRRFLRIILDFNWSLLYRKLRRRYLIISKKVRPQKLSAAQQQLNAMIESLNSVYAAYSWHPFGGKITLIRSAQFADINRGKKFHLTQWTALAKGGLDVHVVPGKHVTLFDEPDVIGLATQLQECLDNSRSKEQLS
ncbi:MAG: condensation domain-containing protein, partial [Saprospiraceae bacterium]